MLKSRIDPEVGGMAFQMTDWFIRIDLAHVHIQHNLPINIFTNEKFSISK